MNKKAMVLAAGRGLRMRPVTEALPKPLVPVAGIPLIDRALDWLDASGVKDAIVNTHYKAELLRSHLATRRRPAIQFSHEETLLETGGGIKQALPLLGGNPFFVINSDAICIDGKNPALQRLAAAWDDGNMDALLLVQPVEKAIGYHEAGDFFIENGMIRRRLEHKSAPFVFTGIQLLHPRAFLNTPDGAFSLNVIYNRAINADGTLPRIRALAHDGAWLHVGDPKGLAEAEAFLQKR